MKKTDSVKYRGSAVNFLRSHFRILKWPDHLTFCFLTVRHTNIIPAYVHPEKMCAYTPKHEYECPQVYSYYHTQKSPSTHVLFNKEIKYSLTTEYYSSVKICKHMIVFYNVLSKYNQTNVLSYVLLNHRIY